MNLRGVLLGRARLLRNSILPRGRSRAARWLRGPLVSVAMAAAAAWIVGSAFVVVFETFTGLGGTPAELRAVLALVIDAALLGFFLFDLETAISVLILDRDLDLLRRAPLAPRAILGIKLVDAAPRTAALLVTLALPALAAFVALRPGSALAWLALPIVLALLWVIPLALGLALTLGLVSRIPARRARESLGLVATLALATLWLANVFALRRSAVMPGEPLVRVRALLSDLGPALERTPGGWAATVLDGGGHQGQAALALAATALASVALAALAAGRYLAPTLAAARTPAAGARRRGTRSAMRRLPLVLAVMRRDWTFYVRDWKLLGDAVAGAVLWALLPVVAMPLESTRSPGLVRAMLLTLAVGLGNEIGSRALPLERRGVAWMWLSPIPARRWVAARLASAAALALAVVAFAGAILGWQARPSAGEWLAIMGVVLPALGLAVTIGLWTGAAFGDPDWTHAGAVLSLGGRLAAVGLVVVQVAAWLLVTTVDTEVLPAQWTAILSGAAGVVALGLAALIAERVARRATTSGYYR